MNTQLFIIFFFVVVSIILLLIVLVTLLYDRTVKKSIFKQDKDDWLFYNIQEIVYDLFYKNNNALVICGINTAEYERYCKILHENGNFKNLVALRIEGMFLAGGCFICSYFTIYSLALTAIFMISGLLFLYIFWTIPFANLKRRAETRLFQIQNDLPRYLSLLEKAMDLPVDQTMLIVGSKFHSPLSEDIIDSINKVSLGAGGWTNTLIDLAKLYDIEIFSDLILEIVNAYEQGVNIRQLINRKVYEVEQNRLYAVESHDAKTKTLIYLPIIIFKILPVMALVCIPMLTNFV